MNAPDDPRPGGGEPFLIVGRDRLNRCFGCGQDNHHGLRLRFRDGGEGWVETATRLAEHLCGVDDIVHGGIQATILDEVCGVAAQLALPEGAGTAPCVTAELSLRFRRPVPLRGEVVARARVVSVDGSGYHVEAAIVGDDGSVLTAATSRWVQLRD